MAYSIPFRYLNEGEQAEAYLKRKQEAINKERNEFRSKYASNGPRNKPLHTINGAGVEYLRKHDPSLKDDFKKADRLGELRDKYPDSTPKSSKSEKKIIKAVDRFKKETDYARDAVDDLEDRNDRYFHKSDIHAAADAARKHYRRTHKHESFNIFESVEFI